MGTNCFCFNLLQKVMVNPQGISKGSGFVAFDTPEEATKAVSCTMNSFGISCDGCLFFAFIYQVFVL